MGWVSGNGVEMGYLQKRESSLRRKNNVWEGSLEPIEIFFYLLKGVSRVVMKKMLRQRKEEVL